MNNPKNPLSWVYWAWRATWRQAFDKSSIFDEAPGWFIRWWAQQDPESPGMHPHTSNMARRARTELRQRLEQMQKTHAELGPMIQAELDRLRGPTA